MSDQEVTDVVAWLASRGVRTRGSHTLLRITPSTRSLKMSNENMLSRRGLFMKIGMLFNGLVESAHAVPIVRFLLCSVTRGRGPPYLFWVILVRVADYALAEERRTRC